MRGEELTGRGWGGSSQEDPKAKQLFASVLLLRVVQVLTVHAAFIFLCPCGYNNDFVQQCSQLHRVLTHPAPGILLSFTLIGVGVGK